MKKIFCAAVLVGVLASSAFGTAAYAEGEPLKVITRVVPPFVVDKNNDQFHLCENVPVYAGENGKSYCGYSQELLHMISQKLGRDVAPQALGTTADSIIHTMAAANPPYDLAIGNMSVTSEREDVVDFSTPLPILNSGIQIMTAAPKADKPHVLSNIWHALSGETAQQLYPLIGLVFLLMFGTAVAVYFVERNNSKSFLSGESIPRGLLEAFWWMLTTIFGQEEAHPKHWFSRVLALMWIPFGVVCVSLFTASITASLTAQQISAAIQGVDDLRDKHVITVRGSTSKKYLEEHEIKLTNDDLVDNIADAFPKLESGRADAIVYDAPALQHYADHQGKGKVVTVGKLLKRESYGIVFPANSPLREQVNQALLRLQEQGDIDRLNTKWFEQK